MTSVEMQEGFMVELTRYGRRVTIDSEDIFYFLNKSQEDLVSGWFNGLNPLGKGFDQHQQITDNLRPLQVKNHSVAATYVGLIQDTVHADEVQLPTNYLYLISSRSVVKDTSSPTQTPGVVRVGSGTQRKVLNRQIQSDDIYRLLDDPFNTPVKNDPLVDLAGNSLHIFTSDKFVVVSVELNYIKFPLSISESQNTLLPLITHDEIVNNAVTLFLDKNKEVSEKANPIELSSITS